MGLAQLVLEHLAHAGQRQLRHHFHGLGTLETGHLGLAVLAQLLQREAVAGPEHEDRMHALAPKHMGHADHRAGLYGRVGADHILHLDGVHVLATGDDHVLEPIGHIQVAFFIKVAAIASVQPAALEGGGRLGRLVPVALHHTGAANENLAHRTAGHGLILAVNDTQLRAPADTADRTHAPAQAGRPAVVLRSADGGHATAFGHAVGRAELDRGEGLQHALEQLVGNGRGTVSDAPHRILAAGGEGRVVEHHLNHAGHQHHVVDTFLFDGLKRQACIESAEQHLRVARDHLVEQPRDTRRMKEGRDLQCNATHHARRLGHARHERRPQVQVRKHGRLGRTGGATGVEQRRNARRVGAHIVHGRGGIQNTRDAVVRRHTGRARREQHTHGHWRALNAIAKQWQKLGVGQKHSGLAVADGVIKLTGAPATVQGRRNGTQPPGGHQRLDVEAGVPSQHADPVTRRHAQRAQRARQARDALVQLGKAQACRSINDGGLRRVLLKSPVQALRKVHGRAPPVQSDL